MKTQMQVFSAHRQPTQVEASLPDGTKVQATVDCLEVQLVPAGNEHGTWTLRLHGADAANPIFAVGTTLTVNIE